MIYKTVYDKLTSLGQQHLLKYWDTLDAIQQEHLAEQIAAIDPTSLKAMREQLKQERQHTAVYEPFLDYAPCGNAADAATGLQLIKEGKMGCLVVAGGQGSRLRFEGPKGMFPISVIKHKSLFQLFAEKALAACKQAGRQLPIAIMTSPQNHEQTLAFFKDHVYFGLDPSQVSFFTQGTLPLLDSAGNLFLEERGSLAEGPDGNGSSLKHFVEAGIWDRWHAQGVRYFNYVLIDNALADPFDAELLGFHVRKKAEITLKCTPRRDATEKVGVLIKQEGHVHVVEYSEMPEAERTAIRNEGTLKHLCANLSLFCCNMDFIKNKIVADYQKMPLHLAFKAVKHLTENGEEVIPPEPMAWKFERFIFDILPLASRVAALLYPREACFAPLKNFSGDDSPATVKTALQLGDRRVFKRVTGREPPDTPFELSQAFHYPTAELLAIWKNLPANLPPYIE